MYNIKQITSMTEPFSSPPSFTPCSHADQTSVHKLISFFVGGVLRISVSSAWEKCSGRSSEAVLFSHCVVCDSMCGWHAELENVWGAALSLNLFAWFVCLCFCLSQQWGYAGPPETLWATWPRHMPALSTTVYVVISHPGPHLQGVLTECYFAS